VGVRYVNPVPASLILTGIVIAVSITAFALGLIIKLYRFYGTLDADEIAALRSRAA
jgi:multicomponent Na+:H+ antiporter subunit C